MQGYQGPGRAVQQKLDFPSKGRRHGGDRSEKLGVTFPAPPFPLSHQCHPLLPSTEVEASPYQGRAWNVEGEGLQAGTGGGRGGVEVEGTSDQAEGGLGSPSKC